MPSKSRKQAKFMAACSHGANYSSCPPQNISEEFNKADQAIGLLKAQRRKNTSKRD